MTDRLKGCTVVFDRDIREDDAEWVLNAIQMIKGVLEVKPSLLTADDYATRQRLAHNARMQLYEFAKGFEIDDS